MQNRALSFEWSGRNSHARAEHWRRHQAHAKASIGRKVSGRYQCPQCDVSTDTKARTATHIMYAHCYLEGCQS